MRELFPSRTPFIPSKCYASLYRYTTTLSHLCPPFPHQADLFPVQLPPSSPGKAPISPKRMKFFLPPVTLLLMGK